MTHQQPAHKLPADLIHDLRTPLNQISGYCELLLDQAQEGGNEALMPDLRKVWAAGDHLLKLIDERLCSTSEGTTQRTELTEHEEAAVLVPDPQYASLLVVDDNLANRDVLSRRLVRQGYMVATAENGGQALEMLASERFDLVLLDILMPEMDGYEVLRRLKADEQLRHIPVIMISALSDLDSVARCIEMGAEDYLPKPFNPFLLKARVSACLEKKRGHDRETNLYDQLERNFARLQESEGLRNVLSSMIVHDLRTPLTSVISGMQTLEMVGELNSDQRLVMDIALTGGETLLGIINDLLDVEKLESGSMHLDYSRVGVEDLVMSAAAQITALAENKQLTIIQSIPADLPALDGDEKLMSRILVNLLGNAIKFSPVGGSITIEAQASRMSDSIEFSVTDTGQGIPPEAFERIFEKFGQVEQPPGASRHGTGLGLTFCRLAAESHGGSIRVASLPSQGSRFTFEIPLKSPSRLPELATAR